MRKKKEDSKKLSFAFPYGLSEKATWSENA